MRTSQTVRSLLARCVAAHIRIRPRMTSRATTPQTHTLPRFADSSSSRNFFGRIGAPSLPSTMPAGRSDQRRCHWLVLAARAAKKYRARAPLLYAIYISPARRATRGTFRRGATPVRLQLYIYGSIWIYSGPLEPTYPIRIQL